MSEYEVITDYDIDQLKYSVSQKLKDGWQLAGGISTILYVNNPDGYKIDGFDTIMYLQAIMR